MSIDRHDIQCVVAFDFTPSAQRALARAVDVAARATDHVLHVITVLDGHATYEIADKVRDTVLRFVTAAFAGRPTAEDVRFFVHVRIGKAGTEILDLAKEVGADMIFIGSHGKMGLPRLLLGSVSERIVREAGCPVIVVRAKSYPEVHLEPVTYFEHDRTPHRQPHSYAYSNRQVITRPDAWPIS